MNKLFLIDAYALIFRSYYAFIRSPRFNSKGLNTSAIFGFTNTLLEVLNKEKPSHIAVVFDPPRPSFRKEIYNEYKANRQETPEDIKKSVPVIKNILDAFNINVIEVDNYEADDTIGTLAKRAEKQDYKVFMMTPDKDFAQLVSENIFMFKPKRMGNDAEIIDVEKAKQWFNVETPEQVIDILALWGDASDNIPGAPGIGEKTAKKLIAEFGSVENLIANTDKLKGKQRESIENNKEQILLSKKLATIFLNVPINIDFDNLKVKDFNNEKINEIFNELEFRTLLNRITAPKNEQKKASINNPVQGDLFAQTSATAENNNQMQMFSDKKTLQDIEHNYILTDTKQKRTELINKLNTVKEFCFDTETTDVNTINAQIVGLSFAFNEGEAFYIPFDNNFEKQKEILQEFKPVFENNDILKIGQNIKFDILILKNYDINIQGKLFDTMIAHYLLEPELRHNLDYLADIYLDYKTIHIDELIGKRGKNQLSMQQVPVNKITDYACEDADVTLKLKNIFYKKLDNNNLLDLFNSIEMPLVYVLADMEFYGVSINTASLNEYSTELQAEIEKVKTEIYKLAGKEFNISSPKQLGEILFDDLKIDSKPKKTKTKQYSTGEDILKKYQEKHPIINLILDYRGLTKLNSTYVEALPKLINAKTGKIHTSYNQAIASTGRLSSTNPNLQNIPIRDSRGKEVRRTFVPSSNDFTFLSADYSQIELRIMAHFSGDEHLIQAFKNDEDIHKATAAKIYNIPLNEVTKKQRSEAKSANFGIIYGISAFGLAENTGLSRKEAKILIDNYFANYPGVKEFMDKSIEQAREKGYVVTLKNRKRFLPDINSRNHLVRSIAERNAINSPIQGSAADIIKIAMINIFDEFNRLRLKSKLIMQVHDELNFDIYKPELETVKQIIKDKMENAVNLSVNLTVDIGIGNNWLEAH